MDDVITIINQSLLYSTDGWQVIRYILGCLCEICEYTVEWLPHTQLLGRVVSTLQLLLADHMYCQSITSRIHYNHIRNLNHMQFGHVNISVV